jgi:hypothetical protein
MRLIGSGADGAAAVIEVVVVVACQHLVGVLAPGGHACV